MCGCYTSWIILIAATLITTYSDAIPLSGFISFGQSSGDLYFSQIRRAASSAISVSPRLPYFNLTYSSIYVSLMSCSMKISYAVYLKED